MSVSARARGGNAAKCAVTDPRTLPKPRSAGLVPGSSLVAPGAGAVGGGREREGEKEIENILKEKERARRQRGKETADRNIKRSGD